MNDLFMVCSFCCNLYNFFKNSRRFNASVGARVCVRACMGGGLGYS
uniref:Uncharacterized protein n=1 Tax=Anguilla anguilla TaxID=7936 RepID=A0A0E9SXR5_ANGAN